MEDREAVQGGEARIVVANQDNRIYSVYQNQHKGDDMKERTIVIPELEKCPDNEFNRPWTADDLAILVKYYPIKKTIDVANYLERSVYSLRNKANALGLKKGDGCGGRGRRK